MKTLIVTSLAAALALSLGGCWESGAGNTQLNEMVIEPPEVNLVAELPAEANGTIAETDTSAPGMEPSPVAPAGPGAPTDAAPVAERPVPPPPAPPKQEPDPHAGHDMGNMTHD